MTIRLVALDLDGTLLDSRNQIGARTLQRIRASAKAGVEFVFCTGRNLPELPELRAVLPEVSYAVMCNGAYVADLRSGETLYGNAMQMEEIRSIYQVLQGYRNDMLFELFNGDSIITDRTQLGALPRYHLGNLEELVRETRTGIDGFSDYLARRSSPVGKLHLFFTSPTLRNEAMEKVCGLPYTVTFQLPANLEFTKLGVNKGDGLSHLASMLGIPRDAVMAIGDNNNDIPMRSGAGLLVAMGNACPPLQEQADFITGTNDEEGVALALEKFL